MQVLRCMNSISDYMFNPKKDLNQKVIECLGKEGKSISSLVKDLEDMGVKHHRLILTGYLRALKDMNILREKEVPPSKIYIPIRSLPDNLYQSVEKSCKEFSNDPDELILYVLNKILKRPIFESELKMAGVRRTIGVLSDEPTTNECKKLLRREGNIVSGESAFTPSKEFPDEHILILADILLETKNSRHLVLETKQTKLL